ncbi:hypothetical protein DTO006G1_7692 [Penicillium roqueforti]|nr:hypothetical protein CBS147337_5021 [Penicillium roqueforti]KAI2674847.1 hypothetical protein CBS147355_6661 [Penicillium roqueforti]KAI2687945.1 hypothetical protein LCP963914a_3463 [Penicillium roqueforti]KAI2699884.1 hypothetical protein CBS147372_6194 [Penicillium roqueforti]KAI2710195.1 hypothetical protein CBS147332_5896 [Penicillium roqueforti]
MVLRLSSGVALYGFCRFLQFHFWPVWIAPSTGEPNHWILIYCQFCFLPPSLPFYKPLTFLTSCTTIFARQNQGDNILIHPSPFKSIPVHYANRVTK